jgi:hypothetical protein
LRQTKIFMGAIEVPLGEQREQSRHMVLPGGADTPAERVGGKPDGSSVRQR